MISFLVNAKFTHGMQQPFGDKISLKKEFVPEAKLFLNHFVEDVVSRSFPVELIFIAEALAYINNCIVHTGGDVV